MRTEELPEELLAVPGVWHYNDAALLRNELLCGVGNPDRRALAYLAEYVVCEAVPGRRPVLAYQGNPVLLARDFVYLAAKHRLVSDAARERLADVLEASDEVLPLLVLWADTRTAIRRREAKEARNRAAQVFPAAHLAQLRKVA